MVWHSNVLKNFPQFIVIYTVRGFGIINKAEVDVFLGFSCFFDDPIDVGNLTSGSSAFSKSSLNIWKFMAMSVLPKLQEKDKNWNIMALLIRILNTLLFIGIDGKLNQEN